MRFNRTVFVKLIVAWFATLTGTALAGRMDQNGNPYLGWWGAGAVIIGLLFVAIVALVIPESVGQDRRNRRPSRGARIYGIAVSAIGLMILALLLLRAVR